MNNYETKDFDPKRPILLIVMCILFIAVVFLVTYAILLFVVGGDVTSLEHSRPVDRQVPKPLLQTNISISTNIAAVMAEEEAFYNRSEVEPTGDGFYRIPLDMAKQFVLERYGGNR